MQRKNGRWQWESSSRVVCPSVGSNPFCIHCCYTSSRTGVLCTKQVRSGPFTSLKCCETSKQHPGSELGPKWAFFFSPRAVVAQWSIATAMPRCRHVSYACCIRKGEKKRKIYALSWYCVRNSLLQQKRPFAGIPFIVWGSKLTTPAKDICWYAGVAKSSQAFPPLPVTSATELGQNRMGFGLLSAEGIHFRLKKKIKK